MKNSGSIYAAFLLGAGIGTLIAKMLADHIRNNPVSGASKHQSSLESRNKKVLNDQFSTSWLYSGNV